MKAIIETGGKQYMVEENNQIFVELLDKEAGDTVEFDKVIMCGDQIGTPYVKNAKVSGKIVKHGKSKKITIFKYRPKKDSRTKKGHRQPYTLVEITSISGKNKSDKDSKE